MFQIDEKVISDSRTLITIQSHKYKIDPLTKNGTINYSMDGHNLWLTTPKVRQAYITRNDIAEVYDKIVIARNGVNIDGLYEFDDSIIFNDNVEVKKDLVVRGNFTVEGKSTVIDTPSLSVEDNIIELNRNEVGNGISLKRAGSAINRGTKPFARSLFDEDHKAFVFDTSDTMEAEVGANWVAMGYAEKSGEYEPGEFRARHRLTAPFGKITDSFTVANKTNLNHLTVTGNADFQGPMVTSDLTINGKLVANNTSEFNGLLTANKVATFNDNVTMEKVLNVKGQSTFDDLSTFNKGIKITSVGANITGEVDVTGTIHATDNISTDKDLIVTAKSTTNDLEVLNHSKTKTLEVTSTAVIKGNTTLSGTLAVAGATTLNAGATINGSSLTVNAPSIFNNDIEVINKNLLIASNNADNGKLTVEGSTSLEADLTVAGNSLFEGNVSINGSLGMTGSDIIARNVTTKNDFKVEQGNGKGLRFWDNDNYKIYMSTSTDSSYGGRLDSSSDYNMYFKMGAGSNRGFVFKNESTPIFQIEGTGQTRVAGKIISKGHDVLTRENEGHKTDATGINADKLDNLHATDFLRRNTDTDTTGAVTFNTAGKAINFNGGGSIYKDGAIVVKASNAVNSGVRIDTESGTALLTIKDNVTNGLTYKTHTVWHKGNQGHNSTLDADTLDGQHSNYFATATHLHDDRYIRNDEVNLKGKYKIEYDEDYDCLDFMYMGDTM